MSDTEQDGEGIDPAVLEELDEQERSQLLGQLSGLWQRVPLNIRLNLEHNFFPENPLNRPLPGEKVLLEIRPAPYRDFLGHLFFHRFRLLLFFMVGLTAVIGILALLAGVSLLTLLIPPALFLALGIVAFRETIEYHQWRLVKTNARLIISIPEHGRFPLVDNIELKGMPSVVDTNWSRSPLWRVFQATTGARDLYLSLLGVQFVENAARVRDALIFPDVTAEDVYELKKLVFPIGPMPVRFLTPQEVKIVDGDD